ncbi:MAG: hypothetical protein AAGD01_08380 [Acidobacteriota bacterium]
MNTSVGNDGVVDEGQEISPMVIHKVVKVYSLYRGSEERPYLRLSGKWLAQLVFDAGAHHVVEAAPGELRLRRSPLEGDGGG